MEGKIRTPYGDDSLISNLREKYKGHFLFIGEDLRKEILDGYNRKINVK